MHVTKIYTLRYFSHLGGNEVDFEKENIFPLSQNASFNWANRSQHCHVSDEKYSVYVYKPLLETSETGILPVGNKMTPAEGSFRTYQRNDRHVFIHPQLHQNRQLACKSRRHTLECGRTRRSTPPRPERGEEHSETFPSAFGEGQTRSHSSSRSPAESRCHSPRTERTRPMRSPAIGRAPDMDTQIAANLVNRSIAAAFDGAA